MSPLNHSSPTVRRAVLEASARCALGLVVMVGGGCGGDEGDAADSEPATMTAGATSADTANTSGGASDDEGTSAASLGTDSDSDGGAVDSASSGDDSTGADDHNTWPAPDLSNPCDTTAPFESVGLVDGLVGIRARFSPDERVALFVDTSPAGDLDIWQAERTDLESAFGPPVVVAELSTVDNESSPTATPDGLTIYFDRYQGGGTSIFRAQRRDVDDAFDAPTEVLSFRVDHVEAPYVAMNPDRIYFGSSAGAGGTLHVTWPEGNGLAVGEAIVDVPFSELVFRPVVTADDLTMYVQYLQTGAPTSIGVMHRDDPTEVFTDPAVVPGTPTDGALPTPSWISPDNCRLYFEDATTQVPGVYVASRSPT
jgi:hypothetical protein